VEFSDQTKMIIEQYAIGNVISSSKDKKRTGMPTLSEVMASNNIHEVFYLHEKYEDDSSSNVKKSLKNEISALEGLLDIAVGSLDATELTSLLSVKKYDEVMGNVFDLYAGLSLTVTVSGQTNDDLGLALDEVQRLVVNGHCSGFDSSDTGKYSFNVDGVEVGVDFREDNEIDSALRPH
jgi:hypothetical protein